MKSPTLKILAALLLTAATTMSVTGCKDDNVFEEAGEQIDEAAQDTKRAVEDATD